MIAFVDTETTGFDPDRHEIWEVGLILPERQVGPLHVPEQEYVWQLDVDLGHADAYALKVNNYYERWSGEATDTRWLASRISELTAGLHLAGACVSFDEERLRKLLRANGACPRWHYHLVDVEAYAAGKLGMEPPWDSEELSRAIGVEPDQFDRHTALGDARWAKAIYDATRAKA